MTNPIPPLQLTGPRGGNLNNPQQNPEARRTPFQPIQLADSSMPGLHRGKEFKDVATFGLVNEQPWHRMAALMILNGYTNVEIAMSAKVKPGEVSILRSQRWFQELLSQIANDKGEEITGILEGYSTDAVEQIHDIMQNAESDRVRLSAAITILEQVRGKPKQFIQSETRTGKLDPKTELEELERDIQALQNRQTR